MATVLWGGHTHLFQAFHITPRLNLLSTEGGCGKTTTLDLLARWVPKPLRAENITAAVLFRVVEVHQPTLLIDELDTFIRKSDELRGLINSGHRKSGYAFRCEGPRNVFRGYRSFAPVALSGIGVLPGTLHDRSIRIPLVKAKPGQIPVPFESLEPAADLELGRQLARWIKDHFHDIQSSRPQLPQGVNYRVLDNWRPLFAIAHVIGADWPALALDAFQKLTTAPQAHDPAIILLADIRAVFTSTALDRMFSADLVDALCLLPDRPYANAWGNHGHARRLDTLALGRALHPFGIRSQTLRINGDRAKGYELSDFSNAFAKHLKLPSPQPAP